MSKNSNTVEEDRSLALGPRGLRPLPPPYAVAPELTPRQLTILALIGRGHSNKQIARVLGIRERTVKFHVASLFVRLNVSSRTEALIVALRCGLIRLDEEA